MIGFEKKPLDGTPIRIYFIHYVMGIQRMYTLRIHSYIYKQLT